MRLRPPAAMPPVALCLSALPGLCALLGLAGLWAAAPAAAQDVPPGRLPEPLRADAFETLMEGAMPMSPDQLREAMRRLDENAAAIAPPGADPQTLIEAETLRLDPGIAPPVLQLSPGFVTTLSLLDASGEPWPIVDIGVGSPLFDVPKPNDGANVIRITPLARAARSNLSVRLIGLTTPIIFKLSVGTDQVHLRYDARIPAFGPGARVPLIDTPLTAGSDLLMTVLDGVPPAGARRLTVSGIDDRSGAWAIEDRVYLRTPLSLLSPGWNASVRSADGMNVYEMAAVPTVLLSDNGIMVRARIEGIGP